MPSMIAQFFPRLELTANEQFKLQYPRYLRWATLVALALTILFFACLPRYEPHPYRKPVRDPIQWVPLDPIETLPEPPRPLPRPQVIEPVEDDLLPEELPVAETLVRIGDLPGPVRGPWPEAEPEFVVSSTPPVLIRRAMPDYPEMARLAQLEGEVLVHVLVGVDGTVLEAQVASGTHPLLDRAALAAARRCVFRPGMQREQPVAVWVALPFNFRLR
jgi:protein TonB